MKAAPQDVYSLGATLYHMVTGDPPFKGLPAAEVVQKHAADTVPWPAQVNPEVSEGLCRVIARMMAKAPDERYRDPKELLRDLDMLREGGEPAGVKALPKRSIIARRPRAKARGAPSGRRSTPKRAGADAPRRARDHARGAGRPGTSKMPYAIAGGAVVALAILALVLAGGSEKEPRDGRPSPPRAAARREPVAAPSTPPVAERAPPVMPPTPPVVESEPSEPSEQVVPEVVPPAPRPITMPVSPVPPTPGTRTVRAVWNSWDVAITGGAPQATVVDKETGSMAQGDAAKTVDVDIAGCGSSSWSLPWVKTASTTTTMPTGQMLPGLEICHVELELGSALAVCWAVTCPVNGCQLRNRPA